MNQAKQLEKQINSPLPKSSDGFGSPEMRKLLSLEKGPHNN